MGPVHVHLPDDRRYLLHRLAAGLPAIGLAAPILLLLLRMIQGFSASGEYAGAATFLAEYAPSDKRGVYCSLVPASTAVGLLVGSTFATVMYTILPDAAVNEWGWRIPFLLAGPLGLVAHYIRTKLEDSPTYQEMQAAISKTDDSNHLSATCSVITRRSSSSPSVPPC